MHSRRRRLENATMRLRRCKCKVSHHEMTADAIATHTHTQHTSHKQARTPTSPDRGVDRVGTTFTATPLWQMVIFDALEHDHVA